MKIVPMRVNKRDIHTVRQRNRQREGERDTYRYKDRVSEWVRELKVYFMFVPSRVK